MSRTPTVIAALALAATLSAQATEPPPGPGIVNLSASATVEVPRDVLSVTFSVTRDGPDAPAVQAALKQALDAALTEARKVARPGQIDVQTGNFSLYPRYSKQNVISGWQGTAELQVEGRDMAAIAALSGRITTMTIARVAFQLSREAREKQESELAAQAIARFRTKAADYAKQLGAAGYQVREVTVTTADPMQPQPMPKMRSMAAASADEALPVEAGRATVTVGVSGSVQLK